MGEFLSGHSFVAQSLIAGLFASFTCGLGVLPLLWRRLDAEQSIGLGYSVAGGLMFAASVYNLLLPAFTLGAEQSLRLLPVVKTLLGVGLGCAFLWSVERYLTEERLNSPLLRPLGGRVEVLVFLAMLFHSIPEGVAVGVGFASEEHYESFAGLGAYIAFAIAIHNIPEGLAVGIPARANGASILKCFILAVLTSLPQPLAAVPASLAVWFFKPLMLPLLGFAAGAMMYLVIEELLPESLRRRSSTDVAWGFMAGFCLMVLVQVLL